MQFLGLICLLLAVSLVILSLYTAGLLRQKSLLEAENVRLQIDNQKYISALADDVGLEAKFALLAPRPAPGEFSEYQISYNPKRR